MIEQGFYLITIKDKQEVAKFRKSMLLLDGQPGFECQGGGGNYVIPLEDVVKVKDMSDADRKMWEKYGISDRIISIRNRSTGAT